VPQRWEDDDSGELRRGRRRAAVYVLAVKDLNNDHLFQERPYSSRSASKRCGYQTARHSTMAFFACLHCGHSQAVDDRYIGKVAACPKCRKQGKVTVPEASAPNAPATSESILYSTAGPLGIRCESWIDSKRHINDFSSLQIEWWTLVDESLPVQFLHCCGLLVQNNASDYPLNLFYEAETNLQCVEESVRAYEVRYMAFGIWGTRIAHLSATEVRDFTAGKAIKHRHNWPGTSEADAREFCGSLAYVARVRLASGEIRNAEPALILREAKRICEKVTEADLETNMSTAPPWAK
jgi:hypothetical protein